MGNRDIVNQYFRLVNAEEWSTLGSLFDENAVLFGVGTRHRQGRTDVLAYYDNLFDQWPDHYDKPVDIIESADSQSITVEIEFTGAAKDGRGIVFQAVDLFRFSDGLITSLSTWYDLHFVVQFLHAGSGRSVIAHE